MSNVSVSRDTLNKIKAALRDFQTSVESSTDHMKSHAEYVITSTRASIKNQQAVVDSLKNKVMSLSDDIEQHQGQIISNNYRLSSLKNSIENASSRVSGLDTQLARLNSQKQQLSSQNSSSGNNDNSTGIRKIENQIYNCEGQRRQLNEQISSMRNQENSLNTQNDILRDEKARLETTFAARKNELTKASGKSERMKSAGAAVEASISSFLEVAQHFRHTAIAASSTGVSGIQKCISAVDEYLATNLDGSSSGNSNSMNTESELAQIAEMETTGEFDITAMELLNATRVHNDNMETTPAIVFDLPANTERYSIEDFASQVLMQEDGLNSLTVGEFIRNFENRAEYGRDRGGNMLQAQQRENLVEMITEDIVAENPNIALADARSEAEECAAVLVMLHNPDQIAGGSGYGVTAAGSRSVNSALGSLWRHGRARALYEQICEFCNGMSQEDMNNTRLNVRLLVHER